MWAISLALAALSLFLLVLNSHYPDVPIYPYWAENLLFAVGFSTVGAVIASRSSSKNPIGWLFCAIGLSFGVIHFSAEYAIYALLVQPGTLVGGEAAAWILTWGWVLAVGLIVFLALLFPDGRLPSRRWRWFAWLSLLLIFMGAIWGAFTSGLILSLGRINNPLGVEGLPNVWKLTQTLMLTLIFVAAASLFVRLRRARGVERQQIKWFTYTGVVASSAALLTYTISEALGALWLKGVGYVVMQVALIGMPISMGIAILRYRLYNIDLLINRTLVYGALTALLVAVYFGGVTATQAIFRTLTGQEEQPQLGVVVSTLVIAALFTPLRQRIQSFIDRRFYRRKYDAAKTLEAFGSRLRDETDLERIAEDLGEVVDETMQPSHISLWLSFPASPKRTESSSEVRSRSISKQSEPPPQ
jgi:MFS family permease